MLLNIVFILSLGVTSALGLPASTLLGQGIDGVLGLRFGDSLAFSVPLGGIAQLALVWWAARRAGYPLTLRRPRWTPELRRLAIIAAPAALAGGVVQINLLIGRQVASFFDGAVVWLYNADRLYQLPLGVVGVAIGVVLLPELSRRLAAGDVDGQQNGFNRATEVSLGLTVPAAVALVAVPTPLVATLFQRGAFGAEDTAATALALAIYGLGLPAFVLQKVLQPLYFAREDTRRPFYYALAAMVVNAALAVGLAPVFGFAAAALGTTLAAWAMVGLLWRGSRAMGRVAEPDARLLRRLPRIAVAALAMGAILWLFARLAADWFAMPGLKALALLALVGIGMVSYFGIGHAIGAFRLADLRGAVRRRR